MKAKIIRPDFYEGDKLVKLKATVKDGDVTKSKIFSFLVRKADRTPSQALAEDEAYIRKNIKAQIKEDVYVMTMNVLPAGSTVVWDTANSKNLSVVGKVNRPDFGLPDENVTITATLTNGSETKEVVINSVIKSFTEEDEMAATAKKITWELIRNKNIDKARITTDLNFPEKVDEIDVTWSSSNETFISNTGKVNRPEYGDSDIQVTITATLVKGDRKTVVTLTGLKVLKKSASAQQRVEEYVNTPDKWLHWVTANGTNENEGLSSVKESFVLPAEQDDMMLTWEVVNSSGEPTEVSYFKIEYQDDSSETDGATTYSGSRRYVATVVRPLSDSALVSMKVTAEVSETEIEDVTIPGGSSSAIHQVSIIKVDSPGLKASEELLAHNGRATWSAPFHNDKIKSVK